GQGFGLTRRALPVGFYSPRCERTEHHGNCQHLGNYARSRKNAPSTRSFDVEGYSVAGAATGWRGGVCIQRGKETMGMTCEEVWRDISDYVDDELDPKQRTALEEHSARCRQCAAVLEGTCNVIRLYRDERVLAPPEGFHDRLLGRLNQRPEERVRPSRLAVLAWALTAAAAVPFGFALFSAKRIMLPRLEHQSPSGSPDSPAVSGLVAVSQDGHNKVFHI